MTTATPAPNPAPFRIIEPRFWVWAGIGLIVMVVSIVVDDHWFLNFVHVIAGVMWTGIDLFMGFIVGPIMRGLNPEARFAMTTRLMPRMLPLMPALSIATSTSGWFLAVQQGYLDLAYPEQWWLIAALVIVTVLTIQGLGVLLPTNVRVLLQLRKETPDTARIGRWMRRYIWVIASQAIMQIAIIVVMARFVSGL